MGRTNPAATPINFLVAAPNRKSRMSAAITGKKQCIGRKCGEKYLPGGEEGRFYRYKEDRCKAMCAEDANLCKACEGIQTKYMMGDAKGISLWHGKLGEALPPKSHIEGSEWNAESRVKEDARFAKLAAKTATAAASETVAVGTKITAAAKAAEKAAAEAEKAAVKAKKEAEKAAADAEKAAVKAVADAEKAVKKAVKEATVDMKEHLAALSGAANVIAGLPARKRRATTAKRTVAARKRSSSNASRRATRRRSSSQTGNPFRAGAAVPPSPPMIYRPVSRISTPASGYVPRNLSGNAGAIVAARGASPNTTEERMLKEIMASVGAPAATNLQ